MQDLLSRRAFTCLSGTALASIAGCSAVSSELSGSTGYDLPYRVRLKNRTDQHLELDVTLTELSDGEPNGESTTESYTLKVGNRISMDDRLDSSTAYRVTVSIVNGDSKSWSVSPYQSLTIVVTSTTGFETSQVVV